MDRMALNKADTCWRTRIYNLYDEKKRRRRLFAVKKWKVVSLYTYCTIKKKNQHAHANVLANIGGKNPHAIWILPWFVELRERIFASLSLPAGRIEHPDLWWGTNYTSLQEERRQTHRSNNTRRDTLIHDRCFFFHFVFAPRDRAPGRSVSRFFSCQSKQEARPEGEDQKWLKFEQTSTNHSAAQNHEDR